MRSGLLILALLLCASARAETVNRWIQYGENGTVLLRAITDRRDDACPLASVDGVPVPLAQRGHSTDSFPVTLCEAAVRPGGTTAIIDGALLKMPAAHPRRIVVIGDTGCRGAGKAEQNCNDTGPDGFPLPQIAQMVAAFSPDLIVHVGDYYYRESPCEPGRAGCANTPYGDAWPAWNADWFTPARAMMAAAPLALSRGNHESCGRGAVGWFSLIDVRAYDSAAVGCSFGSRYDTPPSYLVDAGRVALIMFDSSFANTGLPNPNTQSDMNAVEPVATTYYKPDVAAQVAQLDGKPAFFVTHRPAYGYYASVRQGETLVVKGGTPDEMAIFADGVPEPIRLLLSGHIHEFEAVQLAAEGAAPQLVVGMSGTMLDRQALPTHAAQNLPFQRIAGFDATAASTLDIGNEFGFAVFNETESGYAIDLYWLDGVPHGHCNLSVAGARRLDCTD